MYRGVVRFKPGNENRMGGTGPDTVCITGVAIVVGVMTTLIALIAGLPSAPLVYF